MLRMSVCANCRFWQPYHDGSALGLCHRFPPNFIADVAIAQQVGEGTGAFTGFFPETMPNEWCGEWLAKGAPQATM
jgi:hypothetical protein